MGQVTELWLSFTLFGYQLIAKPGNKTAAVSWPDPYNSEFIPDIMYDTPFIYLYIYI